MTTCSCISVTTVSARKPSGSARKGLSVISTSLLKEFWMAEVAINMPGLWASAAAQKATGQAERDSYLYVVGPKNSGKTTAVNTVVRPNGPYKAGSDVVDFWCVRKANAAGKHDSACIWELPGDDVLADAISAKDKVPTSMPLPAFFLPAKSISTAAVVITVDLSRPWTVVESALTWIKRTTRALNEQFQALEKRGSPLPAQLKARSSRVASAAAAKGRVDGQGIQFSGIQMLIVGTKWDAIEAMDSASKAVLASALRCVAHAHGCHLVFSSSPAAPVARQQGRQQAEHASAKKLRHLLTHMMFIGLDKKLPVAAFKAMSATKEHPEVTPDMPLCILHGTDSFEAIGLPDGSKVVDCNSAVAAWKAQISRHFPAQDREPELVSLESIESDEKIDAVVTQLREQVKLMAAKEKAQADRVRQQQLARKKALAAS
eukprot:jgi/Ulvmu1/477/UM001_0485.1